MTFSRDHVLEIDAPPAVVWEVITDFPRYTEWNPFVVGCNSTLEPGTPIDLRVKIFARPQDQREWMTEHVPGAPSSPPRSGDIAWAHSSPLDQRSL